MSQTISSQLLFARQRLAGQGEAALEAEILLAYCLESSRSFLYANPELHVPANRVRKFAEYLQRRIEGTPIAYLTGTREFWSLPLRVTDATLIPRPETELLVETALALIPPHRECKILDLGTGAGTIALAIASERGRATILAVDICEQALAVARHNARYLNLNNVSFARTDWCKGLEGTYDFVLSNPPYIEAGDHHLEQGDLRFEPRRALAAGADGLDAIREIVGSCPKLMQPGAHLLLEHGFEQGLEVRALLAQHGFSAIETLRDLESRERVTRAQYI